MRQTGMISEETWHDGYKAMSPYFGPDFGGGEEVEYEYEYEDEDEDDQGGDGRVLSAEYVLDSSE